MAAFASAACLVASALFFWADNGTFFSLILVYFANLLLFLVLLRLFNAVSLHRFLTDCVHNAERLWDALRDLLMLAAGLFL